MFCSVQNVYLEYSNGRKIKVNMCLLCDIHENSCTTHTVSQWAVMDVIEETVN